MQTLNGHTSWYDIMAPRRILAVNYSNKSKLLVLHVAIDFLEWKKNIDQVRRCFVITYKHFIKLKHAKIVMLMQMTSFAENC